MHVVFQLLLIYLFRRINAEILCFNQLFRCVGFWQPHYKRSIYLSALYLRLFSFCFFFLCATLGCDRSFDWRRSCERLITITCKSAVVLLLLNVWRCDATNNARTGASSISHLPWRDVTWRRWRSKFSVLSHVTADVACHVHYQLSHHYVPVDDFRLSDVGVRAFTPPSR